MNVAERRQLHPEMEAGKPSIPSGDVHLKQRGVRYYPSCPCAIRYPCPIHDPVLALAIDDGDECDT